MQDTGCTLILYYIVSAFDFIFCSQMPFECTTHTRPPFFRCAHCTRRSVLALLLAVHYFYIVSAFDFIIFFFFFLAFVQDTGCTLILYYIVSVFDFIFCSQMPFECTTHTRPPFFRCAHCTRRSVLALLLAVH